MYITGITNACGFITNRVPMTELLLEEISILTILSASVHCWLVRVFSMACSTLNVHNNSGSIFILTTFLVLHCQYT
jgi:hypothetical protein